MRRVSPVYLSMNEPGKRVIFVDLDGWLIRGALSWRAFRKMFRLWHREEEDLHRFRENSGNRTGNQR